MVLPGGGFTQNLPWCTWWTFRIVFFQICKMANFRKYNEVMHFWRIYIFSVSIHFKAWNSTPFVFRSRFDQHLLKIQAKRRSKLRCLCVYIIIVQYICATYGALTLTCEVCVQLFYSTIFVFKHGVLYYALNQSMVLLIIHEFSHFILINMTLR